VVVAAAGALSLAAGGCGDGEGGPLRGPEIEQALGWPVVAGHPISFSDIEVVNTGTEPVVLERVELIDGDPGIRVVGALAAEHEGDTYVANFEDFPPDPNAYSPSTYRLPLLADLEGYIVPPQPGAVLDDPDTHGTQLHIGLEVVANQAKLSFESLRIHYRVGDERHALTVGYAVSLCTPRSDYVPVGRYCNGHLPYQEEIPTGEIPTDQGPEPETTAG
jgi:hypothetical protein